MFDHDVPLIDPEVASDLPLAYVSVLHGVAACEDDRALAARADIEVSAVPAVVRVAVAKLLAAQLEHRVRQTRRAACLVAGHPEQAPQ
ncbi:MAG TPA: hypothetical protein VM262_05880 [Acidimicrobiales bacterium]|nr:hypothetical protein [Acidimicrobiales bacterium]